MDGAPTTFCLRIPAQGGEAESEPVTVICDRYNARLLLDDGEELVFDRDELKRCLAVRGEQAA